MNNPKQINKKADNKSKPKKHQFKILIAITGAIIILCSIGFFSYKYYEAHREIGIDNSVKATNGNRATGKSNWIRPQSVLASGHGNAYLFLTQLSKSTNGNREFSNGKQLTNNLILLLTSGQPQDVNQAAALYARNQRNYHFTNNDNRLAASVGQTAMYYNNYFNKIKGISDYAAEKYQTALGKLVKNEVNDPISLSLIGSQILQPGQLELIEDPNSAFANLGLSGIKYFGTIQYHTHEDLAKIRAVNLSGTNKMFHPEKDAIKTYGENFHALYISTVSDPYENNKMLIYIIEDNAGKMHYWGNYYYKSPRNMGTYADYQKITKNVKPDQVTGKDINWSTFVDSLK